MGAGLPRELDAVHAGSGKVIVDDDDIDGVSEEMLHGGLGVSPVACDGDSIEGHERLGEDPYYSAKMISESFARENHRYL